VSYQAPQLGHFFRGLTKGWQFNSLFYRNLGLAHQSALRTNVSARRRQGPRRSHRQPLRECPGPDRPPRAGAILQSCRVRKAAPGTFGNLGRDALYGPGFGSVISQCLEDPITERFTTEFRAEIFNLFNRTNWGEPRRHFHQRDIRAADANEDGSSAPGLGFGEPRNVQLGLKVIF